MRSERSSNSRRSAKNSPASATYRWLPHRSRCRTTSSVMRRDGVGWWISRASKNISDRGSLTPAARRYCKSTNRSLRQRRLDRSALPHESNHLGQTVEIDLSLLGENASFRLEIKGERLPRDLVRRSGQFHDCGRYFLAIGGVADEPKRRGESAHETHDRVPVLLRPSPARGNDLELECRHCLRRHTQSPVALPHSDEILGLTERHRVALSPLEAIETYRRAHQFLDGIVGLAEPLERQQLAHGDRNRIDG